MKVKIFFTALLYLMISPHIVYAHNPCSSTKINCSIHTTCSKDPAGTEYHWCCNSDESCNGSCQANGNFQGGTCSGTSTSTSSDTTNVASAAVGPRWICYNPGPGSQADCNRDVYGTGRSCPGGQTQCIAQHYDLLPNHQSVTCVAGACADAANCAFVDNICGEITNLKAPPEYGPHLIIDKACDGSYVSANTCNQIGVVQNCWGQATGGSAPPYDYNCKLKSFNPPSEKCGISYYANNCSSGYTCSGYGSSSATCVDSTPPTHLGIIINNNAALTTSSNVTIALSASDNVGVTGYYLSENSTTPASSAPSCTSSRNDCWTSVTSIAIFSQSNIAYTLTLGSGVKTVYAWFKDAAGNISVNAYKSITVDLPPQPFTLNAPSLTCQGQALPAVNLNWQASTNAVSYEVWRGTSASTINTLLTPTAISITTYLDPTGTTNNPSPHTTYYYYVIAKNASGVGTISNTITATTLYCDLSAPTLVISGAESCSSTPATLSNRCYITTSGSKQLPCKIPLTSIEAESAVTSFYYRLQQNPTTGSCFNGSSFNLSCTQPSADIPVTATQDTTDPKKFTGVINLSDALASFTSAQYRLTAKATNPDGYSTTTLPIDFTIASVCLDPWLQTTGGDVHSNIKINTPGGP